MAERLVLIGAGSAMFTQGLAADMFLSPDLGPWEPEMGAPGGELKAADNPFSSSLQPSAGGLPGADCLAGDRSLYAAADGEPERSRGESRLAR